MTDPFEVLGGPDAPVEPRAEFRSSLRSTLVDELGTLERWTGLPERVPVPGRSPGGIWAAVNAADAPALIRLLVDVFGFSEQLVVLGERPDVVEHSQLLWPEGGTVQVGSADRPGNVFSQRPVGAASLYVITGNPDAVWQRCRAAGVEVVAPPVSPEYDPGGMVFTVRDPEGNLWSFGTYAG